MPTAGAAVRASFLSVAVWWAVFSVPLFRRVPEPPRRPEREHKTPVREAFQRLARTFREIKQYRQLFKFLVAFWLYADGIGTIIKMATIYGAEIGIGTADLAGALLLTQIVGIPLTLLFGKLSKRLGTKPSIYLALGVYTLISHRRLLYDPGLALLGAGGRGGHRAGRQPGAQPLAVRRHVPQDPLGRVLWLLRHQQQVRRHRRAAAVCGWPARWAAAVAWASSR